ncbi:MAG: hypothetical protein QOF76_1388 [Solirubrobacteraceae bacterium]|jgi:hypothetical protein|nr:hypothetical protein [Solirubrobacteraceae bacterium]
MTPELPPVQAPEAWLTILEALQNRGVQFLIAGSAADAIVEQNPESAGSLIIAPAPFRRNRNRLVSALEALDPTLRAGKDDAQHLPFDLKLIVDRADVRWRLWAAGTEFDIISTAVGDSDFEIRLWRTKPLTLACGPRTVTCEVEFKNVYATIA